MTFIGLLVLGLGAGILSGMFGIGGGIVIVPVLATLFGFALENARANSLAALMLPVAIFACIAYYRAGKLKMRISALVALGLIVGSLVGAQIALGIPTRTLQLIYGAFLIWSGWRFVEPRKWIASARGQAVVESAVVEPRFDAPFYTLLLVGFGAGIVSSLFGVGGGIVIVPALVAFLNFEQKLAVGTSLGALLPPVTFPAVITYYYAGQLDISTAAFIAVGLLGGSLLGARITLSLPTQTVKRLYGVFLWVVAIRFIVFG